jgi:IPT/TIG domain/Bacterial Ig-like domain (group 2)/Beta-propeller repeat/Galactose oxidase, central domain
MRVSRVLVVAILVLVAAQIWARRGASGVGNVTQTPHTLTSSIAGGRSTSAFPKLSPQVPTFNQISAFGNLPMRFEENTGQTDGQVRFISHGPGYVLFLSPGESVFKFSGHSARPRTRANNISVVRNRSSKKSAKSSAVLRMKMEGARGTPTITGVDKLPGTSNYLIGKDPSKWRTGVATYAKVQYSEVYPGIDLVYYGNQHQVEYDFVVKPGADPKQVSLAFDGTQKMALDSASGNVALETAAGSMALRKPVIYQMENGQRRQIEGNYKFQGNGRLAFDVKDYNRAEPLVIDPVLVYSTYLGGSSDDGGYLLAVDSQGHAYLTGYTDSTDFPITGTSISSAPNGTYKAFVAKLSADGTSLVYSTYLGGSGGDFGSDVALDSTGNAYIVGNTSSTDFPVTANAFQSSLATGATSNVFLSKLSADGQSLLYSTYLGGGGIDYGFGIAVDANQNAYLTGETTSGSPTPFPTTSSAFQSTLNSPYGNGFISRIDTTATGAASLVYSTFLGGTTSGYWYWDQGTSIAVDANQNVYVVGMASSTNFPITSATAYQTRGNVNGSAYLTQIDTTKSGSSGLIYSTYFGGTGNTDQAASVALDSTGKVYLTGGTGSSDFPVTTSVTNSSAGKGFVAKFDTTRSQSASLLYSTLVGGSSGEFSGAIAVDPIGNAYISGWTFSSDFPVTADAVQSTKGTGVNNSFLAVLSWDASKILYGTYLGGNGSSNLTEFAYGLALDPSNNIYVAGGTGSSDFQTTSGAFQTSLNGSSDAFIAKLTALPIPMISSLSPLSGPNGAQITINGLNFGSSQGSSTVTFGTDTAPIVSWSDTAIVAQVPAFAPIGFLQVTVTTLLEASNSEPFTVTNPHPVISSLSPTSGAPGTLVTITGSQFGSTQGQSVNFNGVSAPISSWSDTSITVHVPAGATTGNVTVTSGTNLTSNGVNFTVPLIVTGLSLISGPVGAPVTITGTGFGAAQGSSTVSFNGTTATVTNWSASSVVVKVPSGATTGNIAVSVLGANSNGIAFTVLPTPAIASLSPTSGQVTSSVLITGTGFGPNQSSVSVTFNGVTAAITSWSTTSITATVPFGAATGNVVVTLDGVASNGVNFIVTAPTLTSIVVTPNNPSIFTGTTQQFKATGTYTDGTSVDLTTVAAWSSDSSVATMNSTGLATSVGAGQTNIVATVDSVSSSANLTVGMFASAGTMNSPRSGHTATVLNNGKVLVTGTYVGTAELYDPISGVFSLTAGNPNVARGLNTATLLNDGTVLIVGGFDTNGTLASAEIYNPATGTFTFTGSLSTPRGSHTAVLLNDGTVLIVGGNDANFNVLASTEIYNPATGTFSGTGNMNSARVSPTATLLNDGTVLIAGGYDSTGTSLNTAEIFAPNSRTFTPAPNMSSARQSHTATLFNDGTVLIAGGFDQNSNALANAEIFNPVAGTFTATGSLNSARSGHTATLLNNGTVFVAGGDDSNGDYFTSTELYDPATATFAVQGNMAVNRFNHTASLLNNGTVLLAGGQSAGGDLIITLAKAELYQPSTLTPAGLVSIALSPTSPSISLGLTQNLTATGTFSNSSTQVLSSVTWSSSDNTLTTMTNDVTNRGHAYAVAAGSPTITACAGSICSSATMVISPLQLTVASMSLTSGSVGTPVVIAGTGFGTTQGGSAVTFNGTAATVSSWSATGIVVTVPFGATSGNVVVTVSGVNSNGVSFTITSSPVINSLSPSTGLPGTSVTISGSNFGGALGGSSITFNGVAASPTSWSNTSIVAPAPANATTGNITVTVSGVASNGVRFNVSSTAYITPQSGPTGTLVTIGGSGFGATQGTGLVSINGTPMQVVSWSDGLILAAVATGTTTGTLSVQQGSIVAPGPTFMVIAPPAGVTGLYPITLMQQAFGYIVSPETLNLLVGESRTVSVTDSNGNPVTVRWLTSNPSVVSLSSDNPPLLTGLAAGSATVYAGVVPIAITVSAGTSQPAGTTVWSLGLDESTPGQASIVPAVPSSSGADFFALDGTGILSAISSDGSLVWSAPVGTLSSYTFGNNNYTIPLTSMIPDFSGNAFIKTPYVYVAGNATHSTHVVQKLDPSAHTPTTIYTFSDQVGSCDPGLGPCTQYNDNKSRQVIIPDTTGILFIQDNATVTVLNPSTRQTVATINAKVGTLTDSQGNTAPNVPTFGKMIVAGDGNAYLPYAYANSTDSRLSELVGETQSDTHLMVLQVAPDGTYSNIDLRDWTEVFVDYLGVIPPGMDPNRVTGHHETYTDSDSAVLAGTTFYVISNGDAGAAVFATLGPAPCASQYFYSVDAGPYQEQTSGCPNVTPHSFISYVSQGSLTSREDFPSIPANLAPALQREDGSYVGTDGEGSLDAIGGDGSVLWQQQTFPGASGPVASLYATSDGGVIVTSTQPVCPPGNIVFNDVRGYPECQASESDRVPIPYSLQGQLGSLYTLDQYGNTTSQTADTGAKVSWTGKWYMDPPGTITSNSVPPLDFALSLGAFGWGNPSATAESMPGAAARPWKFILAWQNDFDFFPVVPNRRTDLTTGISSVSATIKSAALQALKNAYQNWSTTVVVEEGTPRTGDHRAVVLTDYSVCNGTIGVHESDIDYNCNMEQAQRALQVIINNSTDEAAALARPDLIRAIGSGIGNNSAHEIAHQFLGLCCGMDASTSTDPSSAATYNNGDADGDPSPTDPNSDPAPYTGFGKDHTTPIHWEAKTKDALNLCLKTNYVNYGEDYCRVYTAP